jgi:hypothetical protein
MVAFRAGLAAAFAIALSFTACSGTKAAPPSDPATSTTQPSVPALPPNVDFPNTSGFAEGDHNTFYSSGVQYGGFTFRTPDGQNCSSNSYPDVELTTVQCWGPRPDKGPGLWVVIAKRTARARIRQLPSNDGQPQDQGPVLPAEHVLTSEESHLLCGVDDKGTTACRVGDHGFILAPDKTTLF